MPRHAPKRADPARPRHAPPRNPAGKPDPARPTHQPPPGTDRAAEHGQDSDPPRTAVPPGSDRDGERQDGC